MLPDKEKGQTGKMKVSVRFLVYLTAIFATSPNSIFFDCQVHQNWLLQTWNQ